MRYIRIQVQQMTKGVTDIMTTNPDFFTIEREDAVTRPRAGGYPTRSTRNGVGKMAPWKRGRGKRQRGEKCILVPDSDAKWLSYTRKRLAAGKEAGTDEQNSKARPSWDVREEG